LTKIRLVPLEKLCDHSKLYYSTFITPLNFNGNWKVSQIKCVQTLTSRSNASLMYKARSSSYRLFPLCTASLFLMGTISVLIAIIDVSHSFQNTFMLNLAIQEEKFINMIMPPWIKLLMIVLLFNAKNTNCNSDLINIQPFPLDRRHALHYSSINKKIFIDNP